MIRVACSLAFALLLAPVAAAASSAPEPDCFFSGIHVPDEYCRCDVDASALGLARACARSPWCVTGHEQACRP